MTTVKMETITPQPVGKPVDMSQVYEQLAKLNGAYEATQKQLQDFMSFVKDSQKSTYFMDGLTLTTLYQTYDDQGYPYCYLFVSDADAGTTLTFGDKLRTHTVTLSGGWNGIHAKSCWWKASANINVTILKSKIFLPFSLTSLISIAPNQQVNASLTGRNVTEFQFFNALAITDTANHDSSTISGYLDVTISGGRKMLYIYNSLNQAVTIAVLTAPSSGSVAMQSTQTVSVAAGKMATITASDIRELGEPLNRMGLRASCTTAPTTGSLSAWLERTVI